jgi:hypothetical protein
MVTHINVLVKKIPVVVMLIALMLLNGCKDSDKNSSLIFEELNESLERSNKTIEVSTIIYLRSLSDKQKRAETAIVANKWGTIADSIHSKTVTVLNFIKKLKTQIEENNSKVEIGKCEKLYEDLKTYRQFVLNQNEEIKKQFDSITPIANYGFTKNGNNKNHITENIFKSSLVSKNISELLKFENDVRNIQYEVVAYCFHKVPSSWDGYEEFSPIAFQNSTHFKGEEELVVKVGIGHTTLRNMPVFRVNNVIVNADEEGMGIYKMKVEKNKGSYKVPVSITYYKADGQRDSLYKFIAYTVDK